MKLITTDILNGFLQIDKRKFESLFPELIKRLINLETCPEKVRIPDNADIWVPGFDGIVETESETKHICSGVSYWEFGTCKDYSKKIIADYRKRTEETPEAVRKDATLYLVTPYVWIPSGKRKNIPQWEREHDDWKKTIIYDGPILEDWINEYPSVCAWLLSEFGNNSYELSSIHDEWSGLSHMTSPQLSISMFLSDRNKEIEILHSAISTKNVVRVKSDCFYDSLGFVIAAILSEKVFSETAIVVKDYSTYKSVSKIVSNQIIVLGFRCDDNLLHDNNHTIVCYGKQSYPIKEDVNLSALKKRQVEFALNDMGIPQNEASELCRKTRGNLIALMKLLPGTFNFPQPSWTKSDHKNLLYPLLFLESIKRNGNHSIVESLAEEKYEKIDEIYKEFARLEDSPVKQSGDYYLLVNFEEVWSVLSPDSNDVYFKRLINTINSMIDKGRALYEYHNNGISIEQQLLSNLVWYSYTNSESRAFQVAIHDLLEKRTSSNKVIYDNLFVLAETAPDATIQALDQDIEDQNSFLYQAFRDDTRECKYGSILMALEELTMHESTALRACEILRIIDKQNNNYFFSNTPQNSLSSALTLVNMYSALTVDEKARLLKSYIDEDVKSGAKFVVSVLGMNHFYRSERKGRGELSIYESLTVGKYHSIVYDLSEYIVAKCNESGYIEPIKDIINLYSLYPPIKFASLSEAFDPTCYDESDIAELDYSIRQNGFPHDEEFKYAEAFVVWSKRAYISNPILNKCWMFREYYHCPDASLRGTYPDLDDGKTFELRARTLAELISHYGVEKTSIISCYLDDVYNWGRVLRTVSDTSFLINVCKTAIEREKVLLAAGCLESLPINAFFSLFNAVPDELKSRILPMLVRRDIVDSLNNTEIASYWFGKSMQTYNTKDYASFLKYNPYGLLYYCKSEVDANAEYSINLVNEVFSAIVSDSVQPATGIWNCYVKPIVDKVDEIYYSASWAELCIKLQEKNFFEENSEGINRYLFDNPQKLLLIFRETYGMYDTFRFPSLAYNEYGRFREFCLQILSGGKSFYLARMLSTSFKKETGFPIFVLEFLEEHASGDLDKGIAEFIVSNRRMEWIGDGSTQKNRAVYYNSMVNAISPQYQHGRTILRMLSQLYEKESKWAESWDVLF